MQWHFVWIFPGIPHPGDNMWPQLNWWSENDDDDDDDDDDDGYQWLLMVIVINGY